LRVCRTSVGLALSGGAQPPHGELRQRTARRRILEQKRRGRHRYSGERSEIFLAGEVRDDLLRMLFVCCNEAIPVESQLVFALKSLCGFDIREICASVVYQRKPMHTNASVELAPSAETSGLAPRILPASNTPRDFRR